jgi:hypothetical protein
MEKFLEYVFEKLKIADEFLRYWFAFVMFLVERRKALYAEYKRELASKQLINDTIEQLNVMAKTYEKDGKVMSEVDEHRGIPFLGYLNMPGDVSARVSLEARDMINGKVEFKEPLPGEHPFKD